MGVELGRRIVPIEARIGFTPASPNRVVPGWYNATTNKLSPSRAEAVATADAFAASVGVGTFVVVLDFAV